MSPGKGPPDEQRVVLTPEALVRSLFDPEFRGVLEYWRDGRIRPVVTRSLLERYLKLLGKMGVPRQVLRRWMWWFTSPEKSLYMAEMSSPGKSDIELCIRAARLGETKWLIPGSKAEAKAAGQETPGKKVRWVTLSGFLQSHKNQGAEAQRYKGTEERSL